MTSSGFSIEGALPKKERVPTVLGYGSTILKLVWGGNLLYFPGFWDLQPYETCKVRICSESVSRVFPDLFRISLRKCLIVLGAPPSTKFQQGLVCTLWPPSGPTHARIVWAFSF